MSLYIGKNYDSNSPVQSIFRLAGRDEDALTYALGYLMAHDEGFCAKVVRLLDVKPRLVFKSPYSVHLQEVSDRKSGRRDIVVQSGESRIVIEAKIGGAQPTIDQLVMYAREMCNTTEFERGVIVALSRDGVSQKLSEFVLRELSNLECKKPKFSLASLQWHQLVELALRHRPSNGSEVLQFLFRQFRNFIRRYYNMGYYELEVQVKDVNTENAGVLEKGWLYAGGTPAPLYFAPYYTWNGDPISGMEEWYRSVERHKGISRLARVVATEQVKPADLEGSAIESYLKKTVAEGSPEQFNKWCLGHELVQKRHDYERFRESNVWFLYLDEPIVIPKVVTKKLLQKPGLKPMTQIPPGYSLGVDELLRLAL